MKNRYLLLLLLLFKISLGISQDTFKLDVIQNPIYLTDTLHFNIDGNWQIVNIEKEVEVRFENEIELFILNKNMKNDLYQMYLQEKEKGENLYLGKYIYFGKDFLIPFCPDITTIIENPIYKYRVDKINPGRFDFFSYYKLNGKNLLFIDLYCSKDSQLDSKETAIVINENLIILFVNNKYLFLKRDSNKKSKIDLWEKDKFGFNNSKMMGSMSFQFILNDINLNNKIFFLFEKKKRDKKNFLHISKFFKENSNCTENWKVEYILKLKDSLKSSISFPTQSFEKNSKILWITGTTEDKSEIWNVKWKISDKIKLINKSKVKLNITPEKQSAMYLIKNDEVEVLEEQGDWLKVRYYGNGTPTSKTIEGWIKKSDVE